MSRPPGIPRMLDARLDRIAWWHQWRMLVFAVLAAVVIYGALAAAMIAAGGPRCHPATVPVPGRPHQIVACP